MTDSSRLDPLVLPSRTAVARVRGQFQVVALEEIARGGRILRVDGVEVRKPTRYTIQVGRDAHIELPSRPPLEQELDLHPWRFLNHSCAPNARLRGRWLEALQPIAKGDEVTFDYTTTEYDMACPFPCSCGAPQCLGIVRGFRHLSASEQLARAPFLATHLAELLDPAGTSDAKSGA